MKRVAIGLAVAACAIGASPREARAADACELEGVRVVVADAGDASIVEITAKLASKGAGAAACTVDWSRVALSSPEGADAAPTIAVAETFVDHALAKPVLVADGVAPAQPRTWTGPVERGSVAVRWLVEGTGSGLRLEIPRATFPAAAHPGTRVERRAKSARTATGKFGALGEIELPPQPPGAAGGVGPTGPLGNDRIVVEVVPSGAPPSEPIPPPLVTLEALREVLPLRVLEIAPGLDEGWNEVARRAYAAALHGDPLVASLGVHTLAWLGSGLSLQAISIAKAPGGPEVAVVPASVFDAIGDVSARLDKRYGTTGKFLPLGRPAVFRKALMARPWDDAARAKAAKDSVARLASVAPQDLSPYLVPAIVDGAAAPVDPPAPDPAIVAKPLPEAEEEPAREIAEARRAHPGRKRGKQVAGAIGIALVIAGIYEFLRRA